MLSIQIVTKSQIVIRHVGKKIEFRIYLRLLVDRCSSDVVLFLFWNPIEQRCIDRSIGRIFVVFNRLAKVNEKMKP